VPREYVDALPDVLDISPGDQADLVELMMDRLVDYRATVLRCDRNALAKTLAGRLVDVPTVAVPTGLPESWLRAYPGSVRRDGEPRPLTVADLDEPGLAVVSGCAVAIARTGTLILDAGPDQGRRLLSLVPDHHVCVVRVGQIVGGVPEALRRLGDPTRPLTLVSGPSATSDIELNRVEGVHGPRRLDVLIVTD
jgi:L-lactate dehydrogenase complex protein LldG